MKIVSNIVIMGVLLAASSAVHATTAKKAVKHATHHARHAKAPKAKTAATKPAGDLKTDVSFDDSVLHGQYQTPDEALARVENEKGFGDLVGVRKHFKDRLNQASEQE